MPSFSSIPSAAIEVGRALKKSLFTLIKDNQDELERRLILAERGVSGILPIIFHVNGNYDQMTAAQKANVSKTVVSSDITIESVVLYINEAGDAGTTEIGIQTNTTNPTYDSVLSTNPTVIYSDGDDAFSVDGVVNATYEDVDAGDIIKLNIVSSQNLANGFMVRINYTFR